MTKCIKGDLAAMALLAGVEEPSGINISELEKSKMLNVSYSNGIIHIINTGISMDGVIEIYDFRGRKIYSREVSRAGDSNIKIRSNTLAGGVYHIRLYSKERRASAKFVITR